MQMSLVQSEVYGLGVKPLSWSRRTRYGSFSYLLSGQSQDYIVQRLMQYKNKEQVGSMSATM